MRRLALAVVGVALALATLTACDDRECLRGHSEIQLMPIYNGKTTTLIPTSVFVCDEYAPEEADAG